MNVFEKKYNNFDEFQYHNAKTNLAFRTFADFAINFWWMFLKHQETKTIMWTNSNLKMSLAFLAFAVSSILMIVFEASRKKKHYLDEFQPQHESSTSCIWSFNQSLMNVFEASRKNIKFGWIPTSKCYNYNLAHLTFADFAIDFWWTFLNIK